MPEHTSRLPAALLAIVVATTTATVVTGCSKNPISSAPPTIEPAQPALAPPVQSPPAGKVLALGGNPQAAVLDGPGGPLVVFTPGAAATLTVFDRSGTPRNLRLPGPATAMTTDGRGTAFAATRGGFFLVDLNTGASALTAIEGWPDTDFTAIARRADGRLVLGSADGHVLTLTERNTVAGAADGFARVDAIAAQGNTAVVLDRAQTSVTALRADGAADLALRAGLGATTIAADPMGRVLVADTRGGQLLVFGVDPLIERQAYPVGGSPYGVAGSRTLVWVSLPGNNTVVGYDLGTGIPVEKVRYPTVQQPNALAFDDTTGTLYVVSASGAGVQLIRHADGPR